MGNPMYNEYEDVFGRDDLFKNSKLKDMAGLTDTKSASSVATFNPFAESKARLDSKKWG